jgi:hypothetical protein
LAKEGRPDLSRFFDSLKSYSITQSEISSIRAEYGLERVSCAWFGYWTYALTQQQEPVPQGCLDTAVARVLEGIGHVLGKHTLGDDDSIMVIGQSNFHIACSTGFAPGNSSIVRTLQPL